MIASSGSTYIRNEVRKKSNLAKPNQFGVWGSFVLNFLGKNMFVHGRFPEKIYILIHACFFSYHVVPTEEDKVA